VAPTGPSRSEEPIPNSLRIYEELDYLVGDPTFPVVGGVVYLPGPGDSAYVMLALSLPNRALRFRSAAPGFLARYRVVAVVGDSLAPMARLDEEEEVRVRSFRETSRRDESVVFQGIMTLPAGQYPAVIAVRDLSSARGLETRVDLRVPRFDPPFVTAPIAVYEAEIREDRASAPALILNPRATVPLSGSPLLYVESQPGGPLILEGYQEGQQVLSDTFPGREANPTGEAVNMAGQDGLVANLLRIEGGRLPPGDLVLLARRPGVATSDSARLVVSLLADWVVRDYQEALSYLRYAGTPSELDSLRRATPGEQARLLHALWERRDSEPETAEHEFFQRYFDRIREANERFGDIGRPGWLTDRGAAYVSFGPPDEVLRYLDAQPGPDNSQVWVYDESLGFELRLVFTDETGSGAYHLTADSRRALIEAVEAIYADVARR
jgi:GWxTD domain-containing protein